jgi:hypothetical protein
MRHRRIAALAGAGVMVAALATGLTVAPSVAQASTTCGSWRWPVKTGSDTTRYQVSRTVSYTSVSYLDGRTPPSSFGSYAQNHRIKWPEFRTWQINNVTLVAIKLEGDSDLHLRLRGPGGSIMIAEIPAPGCVSSASRWATGIRNARSAVTSRYWVSSDSWHYVYRSVNIQGLGFFDEEHNVTGAAPNDIELHPVTYIRFN